MPRDSKAEITRDTRPPGTVFPTTHWTLVRATRTDDAAAAAALDQLCRLYWYPVYAFLRCRGYARPDAQDLAQGFFLRVVTDGAFQLARKEKGKLRTYLLGALTRHVADHHRHERAEKRGGRAIMLPLECGEAEHRFTAEPADNKDPETLYLAAWARELMERARKKLLLFYQKTHRGAQYSALEPFLSCDDKATPYREIAARVGGSETAVRLQVFRMRQRLAKILREETALTVELPEEIEEEFAWLGRVLRGE